MKESEIRNIDLLDKYALLAAADVEKLFDNSEFVKCACPSCGNEEQTKAFEKNGFAYVTCPVCGTLYTSPRPTQEQLDYFYSHSESNNFFASNYLAPYTEARRKKIFEPRARDIVDRFIDIIGKESCAGSAKVRIGDIGAGTGIFLEELKKLWGNANLVAIEPSEKMAQICTDKGFEVIKCMLENVPNEQGNFDLLTSFELFEHLYEPGMFLEKVRDLLKTGGYVYLTTLNGMGFDIQLLWDKHDNINPPHHINFSNPEAMKILFESKGFEIVSITTPGRLDWDIVEGRMRQKGLKPGRFWERIVNSEESVKESLQTWIRDNNLSSHMCVVAKKK